MRLAAVFLIVLFGLTVIPNGLCADAQSAPTSETPSARKVINKVVPAYPATARILQLSGTVKLEALVLANGMVKSVQVKGGNPLLAQSAQNAVREWRWAKADHDSTETLEFKFMP
ncbi:MAG TPA: energy transducer TonB [Terriglobales bacterium]|jgi:TonB family protein|nr:energy transducer TonB [Terriglobales bacterium]